MHLVAFNGARGERWASYLVVFTGNVRYLCFVAVPVHAWGARRILRWMDDPSNKELVFCSTLMPAVGFVHMTLCTLLCGHTDASAAISFWVCTWFYSQLANQAIKNVFWRRRPIACLSTCTWPLREKNMCCPHTHE